MSVYDPLSFLTGELAYNSPLTLTRRSARKQRYPATFLFAITIAFFIFSLSVFLFSLPARNVAAQSRAALPAMAPVVESASGGKPSTEVHIANNGLVLLRAAKVVSVNGTTLTLSTAWGSNTFTWTVRTAASSSGKHNYGTQFIDLHGDAVASGAISSGDLVTVTGMLDTSTKEPTLDADTVRSLQ
jgi:hypothetical protein